MAVELGTAYVSVVGDTKGLRKDIENALNGVDRTGRTAGDKMGAAMAGAVGPHGGRAAKKFTDEFRTTSERAGAGIGLVIGRSIGGAIRLDQSVMRRTGDLAGRALAAGIKGGAVVGVGGLAAVLFKGFDRYKSLDATAHRLGAMGKSAEDVKAILSDINEVVQGTPIALDEASTSASKFLAGGVKQGKELKDVLTAIADASGFSGDSFDSISEGFIQVQNAGKLAAEDIQNQFRNLPLVPWLAKSLGTDTASVKKMVTDGQIGIQQVITAIEQNAGGMAKAAGDTVEGALRNMSTAVAKTGANFLSAVFGDPLDTTKGPGGMVEALNRVNDKLNDVNGWVVAHQGEIKQFFSDAAGTVKSLFENLKEVGGWLVANKGTIEAIGIAFAGWKIAGLLGDMGKLSGLLGGVGGGGKGGSGILGQLGLAAGIAGGLNAAAGGDPRLSALGALGAGAGIGAQFGGLPGAAIGTAVGGAGVLGSTVSNAFGQQNQTQKGLATPNADPNRLQPFDPNALIGGAGQGTPGRNPLDVISGRSTPTAGSVPGQSLDGLLGLAGGVGPGGLRGGMPSAFMGAMSPAAQRAITAAQTNAHGQQYKYGAAGENGQYDCSGIVSSIYSAATGKSVRITTTSDFASLGFRPGYMPGALNIGSYGAGQNGHMAATLPNGVNVESSSSKGTNYGGPASGATDVGQQWYLPLQGFELGGPVSGKSGPDQILAWLSDGEHVWTPEEVTAVGGQERMMQLRSMAQAGKLTPEALSGAAAASGSFEGAPEGQAAGPPVGGDAGRTQGFIPMAAGISGKVKGGGLLGSFVNLGGEFAKGGIDVAAQAASQAISMAASMAATAAIAGGAGGGTMGAAAPAAAAGPMIGQAAGAGANFLIDMAADAAKRGVDYGTEMANIGIGATAEIFSPFGTPRWLSDVEPLGFMPNLGNLATAVTSLEKMGQPQQPGSPVDPNTTQHGQAQGAPPGPMGPAPGPADALASIPTPEMEPAVDVREGATYNIYPKDTTDAVRQMQQFQSLNMMQYAGRP